MSADVAAQLAALCRGVLLGGGLGLVYDGMRLIRRRIPSRWLWGVLDFSFWVIAAAALFRYSQQVWGGEIRLYGAVFCMMGGTAYFWGVSPAVLGVGGWLADTLVHILGILTAPVRRLYHLLKGNEKIMKTIKKFFPFRGKRSMINSEPRV